jgi:hypothetical protein
MRTFHGQPGWRALIASLTVAASCGVVPSAAHAQGAQLLGPFTPGEAPWLPTDVPGALYEVRVANPRSNGSFGTYDAVVFSKLDTNVTLGTNPSVKTSLLHWYTATLAANIDLFAVKSGDVFSAQQVAAGAYPSLLTGGDMAEPLSLNPALGSFYLGVQVLVPPQMSDFWQGSMGWLKFQTQMGTQGRQLVLVDSFIGYGASSVVVGQVPESSAGSMALLGMGLVGGLATSRRRARV